MCGGGNLTFLRPFGSKRAKLERGLPPSRLDKADASIALRSLLRRFAAAYTPAARRRAGRLRSVYVGERWHKHDGGYFE